MSLSEILKDDTTGLEKVVLKESSGSTVEVSLYGGQILTWKNEKGEDNLFLSNKAIFKPPKAIRGGIPVCFPQFGPFGSLDQHGFARNRKWAIDSSSFQASDSSTIDLVLIPTHDDLKIWPHNFEMRERIKILPNGDLLTVIRVLNTDSKPFSFTFALHTYLSVSDISEVRIEGLETLDYLDNLDERNRVTDQGDSITFDSEFDRVYLNTPPRIVIVDHSKKKTFVISKEGFPDAVVWNPWEKKAKSMADLDHDAYKRFVCVESAVIEKAITLKPGEEWVGKQEITSVPSSYVSGQLDPKVILDS